MKLRRPTPPPVVLRAFDAASRTGSVTLILLGVLAGAALLGAA